MASARAWADAMEAKQKALLELKEAQPKIEFAEAIQASNESISVSTFAKILKQNGIDTGERRLYEYLRNHGYLCSRLNNIIYHVSCIWKRDILKWTQKSLRHLGLLNILIFLK